jgi:CRISPR-associated protein Cmr5
MQTRDQKMAAAVYSKVQAFAHNSQPADENRSKYGSMAHKLPVLIRTAGLAQAFAFANTRTQPQQAMLRDLASVLGYESADELTKKSREASLQEYIWLTQQSLAALLWFKRYAQSILKVKTDGATDG